MTIPFVHLHVHSDYSLLDGAAKCADIAKTAAAMGMTACAVTDHGNMSACMEFAAACKAQNINPIFGCEFYVAPQGNDNRDSSIKHNQGYHLICLAETYEGYINMCHLNEEAWLKGFYHKPRVDKALLRKYSKGIICLSACLAGEVATKIKEGDLAGAEKAALEYRDIFGEGNFYLELQNHFLPEDSVVLPVLKDMAKRFRIPLVCTNDSHYVKREDAEAQEVFMCIGTQRTMNDPTHLRMSGGPEYYFKSPEEMAKIFEDTPEALANTCKIAERCGHVHIPTVEEDKANHYPAYPLPEGYAGTREEYLLGLCAKGMRKRYGIEICRLDGTYIPKEEFSEKDRVYVDRMYYELGIIARMGFTSYYLVVWDFLNWGHEHGVPLGPGRGSGAGSLVAYLIRITDIEPIRYNLLFERFLNPERVSPPDFDIDLCERRRRKVIEYVHERYGEGNVVQIGTFGTLKAKAVVKDVARALGYPYEIGNKVAKLIPADPKMTLHYALEGNNEKGWKPVPELKQLLETDPDVQRIWKFAEQLEGMNRNMSMHAAGVIICDTRVSNVCPIFRGADGEPTTQFSAVPDESLGLLKMDFLGLRNLTIIQDALDLIEKNTGRHLDSSEIPDGDPKAYELLNRGNTIGVFQLESSGMQDLCRKFRVTRLEDIIALIALYRPGPMQFLEDFINRKHGKVPVVYEVPEMEPILKETYGIMLYQEQVMQVVQVVGGFSLGQADVMRRAMGKKKPDVMKKMFAEFEAGAMKRGHDKAIIKTIWDNILKFAGYGFNKSHSAAYGLLAYRTAYLKANYPAEFMAAILTSELKNAAKMSFFLRECREMGIRILPPAVNICGPDFSVDGKDIRFGLAAIRGIGEAVVKEIVQAREEGGLFSDLDDFCERVSGVSHRLLESLIKAGAMDCFGVCRSQLTAMIDDSLARATERRKDKEIGQGSFFDLLSETDPSLTKIAVPQIPEWPLKELLSYEKELLGFYISGHPIAEYQKPVDLFQSHDLSLLNELKHGTTVRVGGYISAVHEKKTKKDQKSWVILELETQEARVECLIFPEAYEEIRGQYPESLCEGQIVFIDGEVSKRDEEEGAKLTGRLLYPMEEMYDRFLQEIQLRVEETQMTPEKLAALRDCCRKAQGETPLRVMAHCADGSVASLWSEEVGIRFSPAWQKEITALLGAENVILNINRRPSSPRPWRNSRRKPEN